MIVVIEKCQRRKGGETVALVLSGGAISGGAFKVGGLLALDLLLKTRSVSELDIYIGVSAGSFLSVPLCVGLHPREILACFSSMSEKLPPFTWVDFYFPNASEAIRKGKLFVDDLTRFGMETFWGLMRGVSGESIELKNALKEFFSNPSLAAWRRLKEPLLEELNKMLSLPNPLNYTATALFSNTRIRQWVEKALRMNEMPNSFMLLQWQRGVKFYVHAVDLDTAEDVIFGPDERNDVTIAEAVQASTALPGFYAPVKIGERYYIDGSTKKTAPLTLAIEKGADLVICYNPFRPLKHVRTSALSQYQQSIAQLGFSKVLDQSIRTLLHSRLSLSIEELKDDPAFKGDLVLIEPAETASTYFDINPLSFWRKVEAAKEGFLTVYHDVARNFPRLKEIFRRHGLELDLAKLQEAAEKIRTISGDKELVEFFDQLPWL